MKKQMFPVRSGGELVDSVEVEVFDNIEEAKNELGADKVLELVNAQHRANVTNAARAKATEGKREKDAAILKLIKAGKLEEAAELAKG